MSKTKRYREKIAEYMERRRPERNDDDGRLSAGGYESDDEEKDEEGDERSTCALTLSCQCITVLV